MKFSGQRDDLASLNQDFLIAENLYVLKQKSGAQGSFAGSLVAHQHKPPSTQRPACGMDLDGNDWWLGLGDN